MNSIPHVLQLDTKNDLQVYNLRDSDSIKAMRASNKRIVSHECLHHDETLLDIEPYLINSILGKTRADLPDYTKALRFTKYISVTPLTINLYC